MIFRHFLTGANESNVFVVACPETREALMVDAGEVPAELGAFLDTGNYTLVKVFVTHDHYDHTDGLGALLERYPVDLLSGKPSCGGHPGAVVRHGDEVAVGTLRGRVLAVPGHTPDALCLAFPGMVFTGDALFAGSVGGTSSPSQAALQIEGIRKHILSLAPETEIHPGHGPSSTVSVEARHNPFLA